MLIAHTVAKRVVHLPEAGYNTSSSKLISSIAQVWEELQGRHFAQLFSSRRLGNSVTWCHALCDDLWISYQFHRRLRDFGRTSSLILFSPLQSGRTDTVARQAVTSSASFDLWQFEVQGWGAVFCPGRQDFEPPSWLSSVLALDAAFGSRSLGCDWSRGKGGAVNAATVSNPYHFLQA